MCCDYVFGGDLEHPHLTGQNQYKLWTRSIIFEGFYCILLLFTVFVAVFIYLTKQSFDICFDSSLIWIILAHFVKPFIIVLLMKFIPSQPMCCGVIRLSPMIFMDLPYAIFVMIFSWFPLLQCITNNNIKINSMVLFILLSCLIIHLLFPLMAIIRFIEVIVFERRVKKFREQHQAQQHRQRNQALPPNAQSNDNNRDQIEVAPMNENVSSERITISRNEIVEEDEYAESRDQFDETADNTFIYGTNNQLNEEEQHKPTSLSNIFAASTRFISSGVVNKLDEEDICIICYDVFVKGKLCARLKCGHFFHRECAKQWLHESATCPLCRIGVTKQ